jgi:hypothetical protein
MTFAGDENDIPRTGNTDGTLNSSTTINIGGQQSMSHVIRNSRDD